MQLKDQKTHILTSKHSTRRLCTKRLQHGRIRLIGHSFECDVKSSRLVVLCPNWSLTTACTCVDFFPDLTEPLWSAWPVTVLVTGSPVPCTVTLVRDQAELPHNPRNYIIISQFATCLGVRIHVVHAWVLSCSKFKTLIVKHPLLISKLKDLGAIKPRATLVKLASCAAIRHAIHSRKPLFASYIAAINTFAQAHPPFVGTCCNPVVSAPLCKVRMYESRLKPEQRCGRKATSSSPRDYQPPQPSPSPSTPSPPPSPPPSLMNSPRSISRMQSHVEQQQDCSDFHSPAYYTSEANFPTDLPGREWGSNALDSRIGLFQYWKKAGKGYPVLAPITHQLQAFNTWCCAPYNFGQHGQRGVTLETYRGVENTVSKFLGFAYSFLEVQLQFLSLDLFTNQVR